MMKIQPTLSHQLLTTTKRWWPSHAVQDPDGGVRWSGGPGGSDTVLSGHAVLPVQTATGQKIQIFHPAIPPQPKLGRRWRLYHRTQRIL